MAKINLERWIKGESHIIASMITTEDEGLKALERIGRKERYLSDVTAYLYSDFNELMAILHIFRGLENMPNEWKITFTRTVVEQYTGFSITEERTILPNGQDYKIYYIEGMEKNVRDRLPIRQRDPDFATGFDTPGDAYGVARVALRKSEVSRTMGKWG